MKLELTAEQIERQEAIRAFVDREIMPHADRFDREERLPTELIAAMAKEGYLSPATPVEFGGLGFDMISHGLLCEEMGRGSLSLLSLLTVHGMCVHALLQWGTSEQRSHWLPRLTKGESLGAFALTEPGIGSDAETQDGYVLNGAKKWISCSQIADVFLLIAQCDGRPTAFLVEKNTPGLTVKPISGMLGFRAAMLGELQIEECVVPKENIVGRVGFGFSHVGGTALDFGRYCVAAGSVGLGRACLEASLDYTSERKQFGTFLKSHQLIQRMLTNMITDIQAARLLYFQAGFLKDSRDPESIIASATAKYFASNMAVRAARDAVQIHGANGCSEDYPVQRFFRDAKVLEIIEGSNEMQQIMIAKYARISAIKASRR